MRDQAVPCVNATYFEIRQGRHLTWEDSRVCSRCVKVLDIFNTRRTLNEQYDEDKVDG